MSAPGGPSRAPYDKRNSSNVGGGDAAARSNEPRYVEQNAFWHVAALRAYPGEQGQAFVRRSGARSDADLVDLDWLASRLSHQNCEINNRLGRGFSFLSACINMQGKFSKAYSADRIEKTGLPHFFQYFLEAKGKKLLEATHHIDLGCNQSWTSGSLVEAFTKLFKFLQSDDLVKECKRLHQFSAHLFSATANILQAKAMMRNRRRWAEVALWNHKEFMFFCALCR